jgi:glycosyltransferase involved in cell wall biosynthesis
MVSEPLVTIGIPTYNRADRFLREAVESALAQDYERIEVVVSDNCSTDTTPDVMAAYAADNRIRYVRGTTNIGANGNFNRAVAEATGDYFILVCDDDSIDADWVSAAVEAVRSTPNALMCRCGTRIVDENGSVLKENPNLASGNALRDFLISWLDSTSVMYLSSIMYNTQELRGVGGFHSIHDLFQDLVTTFEIGQRGAIANVRDVKANFRVSSDQRTVTVPTAEWCEEFVEFYDMIEARYQNDTELLRKAKAFLTPQALARARIPGTRVARLRSHAVVAGYFSPLTWPRRTFRQLLR